MESQVQRERPVLVFGAGGHARSVKDALERLGGAVMAEVPGTSDPAAGDAAAVQVLRSEGARALVAIGDNRTRMRVIARIPEELRADALVAASATVSSEAQLAPLCVVLEHAHVGPGARLGYGTIINTAAVVEHDCRVGEGVHVAPGAVLLGGCSVGDGAFIGGGAVVLPSIHVGQEATVGAGAVVLEDVEPGATVVGVPGRER